MSYGIRRWLSVLAIWLAIAGSATAQERHLYNYSMRHALPEQVLPVLDAQLSAGSTITPYNQQLILNVTIAEYSALIELLKQLDVAPRSLLISVRNQNQSASQQERYGVNGRIGDGNVQVQTGDHYQSRSETRVIVNNGNAQENSDGTQQVRAVEGMAAFISAGNTYPMRSDRYGSRELVPVTSGFYATVRVVDNEVIVDIDQHNDRMQGRTIETQGLQTQVRGQLGTWIPLGGFQSSGQNSERAISSYGSSNTNSATDLAIKIDLANQ
ncbi:MAG TPA: hypothetical protein VLC91_16585 [Spongiibacteraceae bacterium]|nr:hypothetical protein [Spongiibacteraceae bacterium]